MNIEILTPVVSIAAMLFTFLAAILPSIINNHYQAKKENREFYEKHRCEVIENYLKNTARHLYGNIHAHDYAADYASSLAEIYIYAPQELWEKIDEMNEIIIDLSNANEDPQRRYLETKAKQNYHELCKSFSDFSRSPRSNKKQRKLNTK